MSDGIKYGVPGIAELAELPEFGIPPGIPIRRLKEGAKI